jgi:hypothetical protein
MHKSHQSIAALCLLCLLGGGAITGCNAKTEMSKQEEQSFKGTGKMPPEAAAAIAKQMEEAQKKMGASGGPPPQSVPGVNK